jgi:hypothetical protein
MIWRYLKNNEFISKCLDGRGLAQRWKKYQNQKFFGVYIFGEIVRHFLCLIANSENYTN